MQKWSEIEGNKYAVRSDKGYTIGVYIVDGRPLFLASYNGVFIAEPRLSEQHAIIDCNDHLENSKKPS